MNPRDQYFILTVVSAQQGSVCSTCCYTAPVWPLLPVDDVALFKETYETTIQLEQNENQQPYAISLADMWWLCLCW